MEKEMRKLEHCYYSSTAYHCTSGTILLIHIFTHSLTARIIWNSSALEAQSGGPQPSYVTR